VPVAWVEQEVGHAVRAGTQERPVEAGVAAGHHQPPLRRALGEDAFRVVPYDVLDHVRVRRRGTGPRRDGPAARRRRGGVRRDPLVLG
jgi:hypothetical protein